MLVHRGPLVHWYDAFRRGWTVPQSAVRPDRVVVNTPLLDQDFGFAKAVEDFAIEQLVADPGIEALAVTFPCD